MKLTLGFRPVTITLDSPEEVRQFIDIISLGDRLDNLQDTEYCKKLSFARSHIVALLEEEDDKNGEEYVINNN